MIAVFNSGTKRDCREWYVLKEFEQDERLHVVM